MEYQSESTSPTGLRMGEISNEGYLVTLIAARNGTSVEPWLTCISAFDTQCPDFVGQWLVQLYKRMIIAIQLNSNNTDSERLDAFERIDNGVCDWFNADFFMNSNTHGDTKHNGQYVDKLERNLKIAFNDSSAVTTADVMWELCNWRNIEVEKAADQGGALPLILRTALWPEITPQFVFNLHRTVMNEMGTVEYNKFSNYITTSTSQLWMDADSDTDFEARVSPEASHPLTSGDPIEDEEMLARSGLSPNAKERMAFTSQLCDNG